MVPLKDMNLLDDFLFNATITDNTNGEKVSRIILETILARPLGDITVQGQRVFLGNSPGKHGIRLDAFITEDNGDVSGNVTYDLEADNRQNDKKELPRRGRYYHVLRDSKLLPSGIEYVCLPDSYVIFITPYDPLGTGRMLYSMQTMCAEDTEIPYDDGAYTLFLNTKGDPCTATLAISELLTFMEKSTPENAVNDDLMQLQEAITAVKDNEEVKYAAMKYNEILRAEREDGRAEGRAEGIVEGRAEGIAEGRAEGIAEGRAEGEWKKLVTLVCRKLLKGNSPTAISDMLEENPETIQMIADVVSVHSSDMMNHIDEFAKTMCKLNNDGSR